jgi:hypothetical protein
LNESLGAPSHRALDRLMDRIEAEPREAPLLTRAKGGLMAWLGGWLSAQPPRRLAYASAAALVLDRDPGCRPDQVCRAGRGGGFETASAPGARPSERYVMLSFAADAKASDIAAFFKRYDASVVDGPRANGFFKVRVGDASLTTAQVDAIAASMKAEGSIISFVAPAP